MFVSPGMKGVAGAGITFYMVVFGGGSIGLKIAFYIVASGAVLAAICYWISSRHYPRDMEKVRHLVIEAE